MPEKKNSYIIYSDGASKGNPGFSGGGFVVYNSSKEIIHTQFVPLGIMTNNMAEYNALISALEYVRLCLNDANQLTIYLDSELIVKQLNGVYTVKSDKLVSLYYEVMRTLSSYKYQIIHVPRELNSLADKLANEGVRLSRLEKI